MQEYGELAEINLTNPQLRSDGNGQADPGENDYITIGREANGIWNSQVLGDNPATAVIETDFELYPADLFIHMIQENL